ncbi:MAG: hypothetical protein RLY20_2971 [Verrucomicrobiota bacterium]|jgi:penicillin-binding protein 2
MFIFNQLKRDDPALRLVSVVLLAGLVILFAGLWWVQVVCGREYQSHLETQSFRSVRVPAPRGKILDRNGVALADNRPRYDVCLYLEEMRKAFAADFDARFKYTTNTLRLQREAKRAALGRDLTKEEAKAFRVTMEQRKELSRQARLAVANGITADLGQKLQTSLALDVKRFTNHAASTPYQPFPVMQDLQPQQVARFQEQFAGIPGIDLESQTIRTYPLGSTAAHLLGYLRREKDGESRDGEESYYSYRLPDFRGLIGIEGGYDEKLCGHAGGKSVLVNNLGYRQSENIWQPTVPGYNVTLTLDVRIQQAAEKALASRSYRGAIVVMDTRNGDVLAMASSPTFNPNYWVNGFPPGELERLDNPQTKPQRNRATQDNYYPGSVFKIVVALAALELGHDPNELYTVPAGANGRGIAVFGRNQTKQDQAPPGTYTFLRAFIKSSNGYFIHAGLKPGVLEKVVELGNRIHFGERANLGTMQENPGSFPRPETVRSGWSLGATANLCIGQEKIETTPVQVAVMVSAMANGGKVFWPRLVQRLNSQDPLSNEPEQTVPEARLRDTLGVSAKTMQLVRTAMFADVDDSDGSGFRAKLPGFRIGGKTGTAQVEVIGEDGKEHTTWFASMGGPENEPTPRYAVVVMVENGISGGTTCAPVAHDVYQAIQQLNQPAKSIASAR